MTNSKELEVINRVYSFSRRDFEKKARGQPSWARTLPIATSLAAVLTLKVIVKSGNANKGACFNAVLRGLKAVFYS